MGGCGGCGGKEGGVGMRRGRWRCVRGVRGVFGVDVGGWVGGCGGGVRVCGVSSLVCVCVFVCICVFCVWRTPFAPNICSIAGDEQSKRIKMLCMYGSSIFSPCSCASLTLLLLTRLAVRIQQGTLLKRQVGTRAFMSPEMHLLPNKSPGYDQKADIWALGVCLVFLFANEHPFLDGSGILLRQKLISGEVPLWDVSGFGGLFKRVAKAAGVCRQRPSRPAQALMRVLLDPRREKRPWASDALKCEWFTTPLSELDVSDEVPLLNWADFEAGPRQKNQASE